MLRTIKWLAIVLCFLILTAALLTTTSELGYANRRHGVGCAIRSGGIGLYGAKSPAYFADGLYLEKRNFGPLLWIPFLERDPASQGWLIAIPVWIVLVVLATIAVACRLREKRRPGPGYCQACGYNLTGNVTGRCPECGTPVQVSRLSP